jgi:hypothetical protein
LLKNNQQPSFCFNNHKNGSGAKNVLLQKNIDGQNDIVSSPCFGSGANNSDQQSDTVLFPNAYATLLIISLINCTSD